MEDDGDNGGGFGWGLVVGLALGLVAGVFLASGPGRDQVEKPARPDDRADRHGPARGERSREPDRPRHQRRISAARRRRQEWSGPPVARATTRSTSRRRCGRCLNWPPSGAHRAQDPRADRVHRPGQAGGNLARRPARFSLDEIDELSIAVTQACGSLIEAADEAWGPGATLRLSFTPTERGVLLDVDALAPRAREELPAVRRPAPAAAHSAELEMERALVREMIRLLVDDFRHQVDTGRRQIRYRMVKYLSLSQPSPRSHRPRRSPSSARSCGGCTGATRDGRSAGARSHPGTVGARLREPRALPRPALPEPGEPLEDIVQSASSGLIKAIERFDPDLGNEFTTFATPTILGRDPPLLPRQGVGDPLPAPAPGAVPAGPSGPTRSSRTSSTASPRWPRLAERLSVEPDDVLEAMEMSTALDPLSIDATIGSGPDGGRQLGEAVGTEDPNLDRVEMRQVLERAMQHLNERERRIMMMRFFEEMSQAEVPSAWASARCTCPAAGERRWSSCASTCRAESADRQISLPSEGRVGWGTLEPGWVRALSVSERAPTLPPPRGRA